MHNFDQVNARKIRRSRNESSQNLALAKKEYRRKQTRKERNIYEILTEADLIV